MLEIMRTNDIVALSFALSLLQDAGLETLVADAHMSVMEGSIGIFPRRLHVLEDDAEAAREVLEEAGLGAWLVSP
jgi:hypothetical protein